MKRCNTVSAIATPTRMISLDPVINKETINKILKCSDTGLSRQLMKNLDYMTPATETLNLINPSTSVYNKNY